MNFMFLHNPKKIFIKNRRSVAFETLLDKEQKMVYSFKNTQETKPTTNGEITTSKDAILFSEALEKAKFGKFNYYVIFVSGIIMANVVVETSAVAYYMPVAHCDLDLTNSRKGLLSAISYVGIIISSHLWGFLADTQGRRRVIMPTLILAFVATMLSSFATNYWTMVILRFINGIFISGSSATIYAYLGEFHIDRTRSRALMISAFIFAIGAMLIPFLSFLVINQDWRLPMPFLDITYKPWRLFVIVCGLPGLIAGLFMIYLPESPKFLLSLKKEDETIEVLKRIYKMNGGQDELKISHLLPEDDSNEVSIVKDANLNMFTKLFLTMWNQTAPLFYRKYIKRTLIICTTQFWLYIIGNGLYMWFPHIVNAMGEFMSNNPGQNQLLCEIVYAKHENQTEGITDCPDKLENATYLYSLLMEILHAVSFFLIGLIVNYVGKKIILFISIIFFSSCGLVAVWLPFTSVAAIFYVLLFLVGVCINVLGVATVELYPTQLRAMAICVSMMIGRIGSFVGANLVGAFLVTYCEATFYVACFATISCAFLILFLPKSIPDCTALKKPINQES